ncbi:MAG TPA: GNAT family N-acetyltransferase [Spongiibacteraceae bacterium]|nr:GNAT family N-acetyltransferase [Spongiibacteraceae bacterium]HCS27655.1 GNAT family N-acetyltransferase [Spongiibacteraceae bacterium]
MAINYRVNQNIPAVKFIELLERSGLAERRPVDDKECIQGMLNGANLLVTAWDGMKLVGLSRALTDFHYACYLSDLAVDSEYQRSGIGRELIARTRKQLGSKTKVILLAAPDAQDYYPRLGFTMNERCWVLDGDADLI